MNVHFAPWRFEYILGKKEPACVFCKVGNEQDDRKNLILKRSPNCFTVLNRYPYNNCHLMIIPYLHTSSLLELEPSVTAEVMEETRFWCDRMTKIVKPNGFNLGLNMGRAAGAGIEEHIHWHIVPRWSGDMNFMSVVGKVKVIPQSLESAWDMLKV